MSKLIVTAAEWRGIPIEVGREEGGCLVVGKANYAGEMSCPAEPIALCSVFGGCDLCDHNVHRLNDATVYSIPLVNGRPDHFKTRALGAAEAEAWVRAHAGEFLDALDRRDAEDDDAA